MRIGISTGLLASVAASAVLAIATAAPTLSQENLPWRQAAGGNDAYRPDGGANSAGAYQPGGGSTGADDAYRPAGNGETSNTYSPRRDSFSDPPPPAAERGDGYGEPFAPPGPNAQPYERSYGDSQAAAPQKGYYEQGEIVSAGHGFFGSVSQGIASAVEYAFKSQGRPNGYILGEDAGGALIIGLRYGEGTLYTKDAGTHKVFWQGPSVGYDAGAEGSKTMVLVYNLRDPSEIYDRFGGVQGSAYLIGGVSVQFQKLNDVTLAVIRSGVGLRLGANVGYSKYTRTPTWNPL